jgi:hypothetical protein
MTTPPIEADVDLAAEMEALTALPDPTQAAWLERHGVAWSVSRLDAGPVTVGRITAIDDRLFEFTEDGDLAYCHMVWPEAPFCGYTLDIIAWKPANPARWWLRTGMAVVLGEFSMHMHFNYSRRLPLHRTPLDWLAAGGNGACVLNMAAARYDLMHFDAIGIVAADLAHAEEVERAVRGPPPRRPRIDFPRRGTKERMN